MSKQQDAMRLADEIENKSLNIIDSLNQLSIMIENYAGEETEEHWFGGIENLQLQYKQLLDLCHENMNNPLLTEQYPYKLLEHIDGNLSPDQYLHTVRQEAQKQCEVANGKKVAITELREVVKSEVERNFPNVDDETNL
ncbi:hypothetical protein ABK040_007252 [Willaertia magna]